MDSSLTPPNLTGAFVSRHGGLRSRYFKNALMRVIIQMRLPLEMRITGISDVHLAPQHGNTHGTCSIEVLAPGNVDRKGWNGFIQEVTVAWMSLKGDDGQPIHPFDND